MHTSSGQNEKTWTMDSRKISTIPMIFERNKTTNEPEYKRTVYVDKANGDMYIAAATFPAMVMVSATFDNARMITGDHDKVYVLLDWAISYYQEFDRDGKMLKWLKYLKNKTRYECEAQNPDLITWKKN